LWPPVGVLVGKEEEREGGPMMFPGLGIVVF
jgi:hypothetical protein